MKSKKSATKKVSAKKPSKNFEIAYTSNANFAKAINPVRPEGDGWELVSTMFFPSYSSYMPKHSIFWYWQREIE